MRKSRTGDTAPSLLLVGEEESVDTVAPALGALRAKLRRSHSIDDLAERCQEECVAVILADLKKSTRLSRDVGTVHELSSLPLFAVLSEDSSTA
jgi:hypothetical protein